MVIYDYHKEHVIIGLNLIGLISLVDWLRPPTVNPFLFLPLYPRKL